MPNTSVVSSIFLIGSVSEPKAYEQLDASSVTGSMLTAAIAKRRVASGYQGNGSVFRYNQYGPNEYLDMKDRQECFVKRREATVQSDCSHPFRNLLNY